MNAFRFSLIVVVVAGTLPLRAADTNGLAAGSQPGQSSPAAATGAADDKAIDLAMDKFESTLKAGDYSYMFEVMYTPILDAGGGKEKAMVLAKTIGTTMKEHQVVVVSWKAAKPYHYIAGNSRTYVVIPYTQMMTMAGKTLKETGCQFGIKTADAGWQFVNGASLSAAILEQFFPDFPTTVNIPPMQRNQVPGL
jgi:hypothetical protein